MSLCSILSLFVIIFEPDCDSWHESPHANMIVFSDMDHWFFIHLIGSSPSWLRSLSLQNFIFNLLNLNATSTIQLSANIFIFSLLKITCWLPQFFSFYFLRSVDSQHIYWGLSHQMNCEVMHSSASIHVNGSIAY